MEETLIALTYRLTKLPAISLNTITRAASEILRTRSNPEDGEASYGDRDKDKIHIHNGGGAMSSHPCSR